MPQPTQEEKTNQEWKSVSLCPKTKFAVMPDCLRDTSPTLRQALRVLKAAPQPARKLPAEDEEVYNAIKGVDSLDALAVWRAAERFYGIGGAA